MRRPDKYSWWAYVVGPGTPLGGPGPLFQGARMLFFGVTNNDLILGALPPDPLNGAGYTIIQDPLPHVIGALWAPKAWGGYTRITLEVTK